MTAAVVWLGVGLAGAAGAVARFLLHARVARGRGHPLGTLVVNLSGTLTLGVLVGATLDGDAYRIAATGFLGAYTTFSAWMLETHREVDARQPFNAWANIVVSVITGLIAIALGRSAGGLF